MSTSIEIQKSTIEELLKSGGTTPFVIPEYQRPYAWGEDEINTLFNDLLDFISSGKGGTKGDENYFLGSIVMYENEQEKIKEIIDGQQRLTSIFLLLRAIYTHLSSMNPKTAEAINFISEIEPLIWVKNKLNGKIEDYSNVLISSRVMGYAGNKIFKDIMSTGTSDEKLDDNYSENYRTLQDLFKKLCEKNPFIIYEYIYTLLNQAIVLPITATSKDSALTIFSTLNNRGLQLSDADIFKAKIYNHLNEENKKEFIRKWQSIEEEAMKCDETLSQLFYYYMFYLRALNSDEDTTTPGLRKYYQKDEKNTLLREPLMDDLAFIMNFLKVVKMHDEIEDEKWSTNKEILQALDILSSYPNEFWKYPTITYYLIYRKNSNFEEKFLIFLQKLIYSLTVKYLYNPTINAVKGDILKLNVQITKSDNPVFDFKDLDVNNIDDYVKHPTRKIERMLLKILAYMKQKDLLPDKWETEHILPQKWNSSYFLQTEEEKIRELIEHIGNKLPFEKKLNIKAGNGYFTDKKGKYKKSKIQIVLDLESQNENWDIDHIQMRDKIVIGDIKSQLLKWSHK